jgi:nicotinate-nucleotide adenylyltransferase
MIGLFGGSFDPIHHGHLIVAQVALEALGLEQVRFVPAREQPFKVGRHGASPELRAEMVRLAVQGEPRFGLERMELDRSGPSFTIDTLRALRNREPTQRFVLLLGADAAAEFDQWREVDAVVECVRVVALSRPGAPPPTSRRISERIQVPAVDISATEIRKRVQQGRSVRYWVPDAVAKFITEKGLYRDGNG